jgi:hypothetical protein
VNLITYLNKHNWMYNLVLPISALAVFGLGLYFIMSQPKHGVVVYDCSIAEISPDFPPKVREECRKKTSGRI